LHRARSCSDASAARAVFRVIRIKRPITGVPRATIAAFATPPTQLEPTGLAGKLFGLCGIQEKPCYFGILEHSLGVADMTEAGLVADVEKEGQIGQAMAPIDTPFRSGIG
jgi:hypothetical protein